jgi:hypothetical protein
VPDDEDEDASGTGVVPEAKAPPRKTTRDERDAGRPVRRREARDEDDETVPARRKARHSDEDEEEQDRPRRKSKKKKSVGNPMLLWGLIVGGVVLLAGGGITLAILLGKGGDKSAKGSANDEGLPDWTPDPALLAQLGPEEPLSPEGEIDPTAVRPDFRIRPPKGFERTDEAHKQMSKWASLSKENKSVVMIILKIGSIGDPVKEADAKKRTEPYYEDFTAAPVERGRINGLTFARSFWEAKVEKSDDRVRGAEYVLQDGKNEIVISIWIRGTKDVDTRFKLLEASVLTFRRP